MKTSNGPPRPRGTGQPATRWLLSALLIFLCLNRTPPASAAGQPSKSFAVPPNGEIQLALPAEWKGRVIPSPRTSLPTIELSSTATEDFKVFMTPIPRGSSQPVWANLKSATELLSRPVVAQSVEKEADLIQLQGAQTEGYYFSVTDAAPAPGEYKYMSQGLARVGELLVQFTILSNDPTQKIRDTGLEILRTAGHVQGPPATRDILVLGEGWKVRIFDPGLGRVEQQSGAGRFVCRSTTGTGFNLSLFVEQPTGTGTQHADVFEHYWSLSKQNPLIEQDSIKVERNQKFVKVSYRIGPMPNVNYYFAYKGRWVDLHISKLPFAKDDEKLFASFDQLLAYSE
ncbi:MAG TPA: hypothetical protein VNU68_01535 [Verrucomicrobiae bacterium]|nr:hypothetical protein [Verrucomicrobiae bacterium]